MEVFFPGFELFDMADTQLFQKYQKTDFNRQGFGENISLVGWLVG